MQDDRWWRFSCVPLRSESRAARAGKSRTGFVLLGSQDPSPYTRFGSWCRSRNFRRAIGRALVFRVLDKQWRHPGLLPPSPWPFRVFPFAISHLGLLQMYKTRPFGIQFSRHHGGRLQQETIQSIFAKLFQPECRRKLKAARIRLPASRNFKPFAAQVHIKRGPPSRFGRRFSYRAPFVSRGLFGVGRCRKLCRPCAWPRCRGEAGCRPAPVGLYQQRLGLPNMRRAVRRAAALQLGAAPGQVQHVRCRLARALHGRLQAGNGELFHVG